MKVEIKKTFFLAALLLAVFIAGEVFLGVIFLIKDMRNQPIIRLAKAAKDYPYLYYSFRPDANNFINEDGLYTKKGKTRDPGKYRIILTGGSTARSSNAPYNETLAYRLEEELNDRFKCDIIEVINAGMSGYVLEQEFIFIQLVLRDYNPDMIIGLDGCNDMEGFALNRYTDFIYAPHYWRHFKVIEEGKEARKFYFRFKALFRNIFRAVKFAKRILKNRDFYDYSNVTDKRLEESSRLYVRILSDIHDFCASKNIPYYSFLQPIRWYVHDSSEYVRFDGIPKLGRLYRRYDEETKCLSYGFSLADIFEDDLDLYVDNYHVKPRGNLIFAEAIADSLEKRIAEDIRFQNLMGNKPDSQ